MTTFRSAVAAFLLLGGSAVAQSATPATAPVVPAPAVTQPVSADLTKDGKPRMKVVRAQCREETKAQNLKGDARKQAMGACIIKQRPDMEAKVKCRMDPSMTGLDKSARKSAMKACVAKAKG